MPLFERVGRPCARPTRSALTLALAITALAVPAAASAAPTASYSMTASPTQGQPTKFKSSGTCDRAPCTYAWTDPGDGQAFGTGTSMTFTYNGTGSRTVKLAMRNTRGQTSSVTRSFMVQAASSSPPPPPPPPPADTDGDGVPDSSDQCPTQAGPASNNGCPTPPPPPTDTDGDGVPNSSDQCPTQAGPASNNGCPTPPPPPPPSGGKNCAPTQATTMTNNVSHVCGFPDTTTAGVPAGTTLVRIPQDATAPSAATGHGWHWDSRGWIEIDTAGALLQNVSTAANVDVTANDVTIRTSDIHPGGESFGVSPRHTSNLTIADSSIHGPDTGSGRLMVAVKDIYGDSSNMQVLRNDISRVSTGVQIESGLIQGNYIHDMGFKSGDHINGTTSNGGSQPLTIRNNTVFNQFNQTDAISLFEDFGTQANRVIDANLVAGGGYCLYGGQNPGGPAAHDIAITNNHFSRLYYANCGSYGTIAAWAPNGGGGTFTGNVWDDTGAPV